MRKILIVLLMLFTITLTSCNNDKNKSPIVVCTIFPQYDIVRSLAGEYVDLHMAVLPGVDTHNYDPSVDDMILIKKSSLFVYTGDFMENWASTIGAPNPLDLSKLLFDFVFLFRFVVNGIVSFTKSSSTIFA